MLKKLKQNIYNLLEPKIPTTSSIIYHIFMTLVVIVSSITVILEIIFHDVSWHYILTTIEYIAVGIFIIEYLLKLFVSQYYYPTKNWFKSKISYIKSFDSFIDIICVASVFLNAIPTEFAVLRLLKLVKMTRLVKLTNTIGHNDDKPNKLKERIHEILTKDKEGDLLSKIYDWFSVGLISLTIVIIILDTFEFTNKIHNILLGVEYAITIIFALEYVLRVWTAEYEYPELTKDEAKMRYIFSFIALIDLLSILPVFFSALPSETSILKIFKFFKIVRLLKFSRYISGIHTFGLAVKRKSKQIVFSIIILIVLIFMSSVLLYSFENAVQPDVFKNAFSGIIYATTVLTEYGEVEMEVQTTMGQVMVIIMMISGACVVGVPLGIISGEFQSMVESTDEEQENKVDLFDKVINNLTDEEKEEIILTYLPKQKERNKENE